MDLKKLGAKISSSRNARGWSQEELSGRSKVARGALQELEKGRGNPTFETIQALSSALNEPLLFLAGETLRGPTNTIAEMTPKELEELVGRASKPDGATNMKVASLKKQNSELMEYLPEEFSAGLPKVQDWQIGIARFFLTGNREYLKGVRKDLRDSILAAFRFHKLLPAKAPQK